MITLYYAPVSCALVPYVTLTEAGAQFTVELVNNDRKENTGPTFLAVNPKGKVPALSIDGKVLTENVAIQTWIARTFPAARLLPSDPWQDVEALSLMSWFASGIHPHLTPINRPTRYCDDPGAEASVRRLATGLLLGDFEIVERRLEGRDWFFDHFTTVDAYFFWCFRRAILFGLELGKFSNCMAHQARVAGRPSARDVVAFERTVQTKFAAQAAA